MSKKFDEVLEEYRQRIDQGERIEDVIDGLHKYGLTITELMKAIRVLYKIRLADAKKIVTAHPVWSSVVRANEPFHAELEKFAATWSNDQGANLALLEEEFLKNDE